jgi:hypothetical protein
MWFTPSVGLRPPILLILYYLLSIFLLHRATKPTLHRTRDLHAPLQILLPRYWHNTEPSYNQLNLALQVLNTQHAQIIHNYFHLAHWLTTDFFLHRRATSLYITKGA